eukprot:1359346-Rhodomonas_salina.2
MNRDMKSETATNAGRRAEMRWGRASRGGAARSLYVLMQIALVPTRKTSKWAASKIATILKRKFYCILLQTFLYVKPPPPCSSKSSISSKCLAEDVQ